MSNVSQSQLFVTTRAQDIVYLSISLYEKYNQVFVKTSHSEKLKKSNYSVSNNKKVCTHVDPFSSFDNFEVGVTARLNRFFLRTEPFRDLTVRLSEKNDFS